METAIAQNVEQEEKAPQGSATKLIREVRNKNRRQFFSEDKIRMCLKDSERNNPSQTSVKERAFHLPCTIYGSRISWKQAKHALRVTYLWHSISSSGQGED
ncbi:MAG: hypothetical protein V2B13_02975 [Pseudomonadota bacterium]